MNEKKYGFGKIDRDLSPDKRDSATQFDVVNMSTYLTKRGLSLVKDRGPKFFEEIGNSGYTGDMTTPTDVSERYVVGDLKIGHRLFLFTTTTTSTIKGTDQVFEVVQYGVVPTDTYVKRGLLFNGTHINLGHIKMLSYDEINGQRQPMWFKMMRIGTDYNGAFGYTDSGQFENFYVRYIQSGSLPTQVDFFFKIQMASEQQSVAGYVNLNIMSEHRFELQGSTPTLGGPPVTNTKVYKIDGVAVGQQQSNYASTVPISTRDFYIGAVNRYNGSIQHVPSIFEEWSHDGIVYNHSNNWNGIDTSAAEEVFTVDNWITWSKVVPKESPASLTADVVLREVHTSQLRLSTEFPVDCVGGEANGILKAYLVDGNSQPRFIDLTNGMGSGYGLPYVRNSDFVPALSKPYKISAKEIPGTASYKARARYAVTVYDKEGSITRLSALSAPVNLNTEHTIAEVTIDIPGDSMKTFQGIHVRLYRLAYTEYASPPIATLIWENSVSISGEQLTVIDDGSLFIANVDATSILDIGGKYFVPNVIATNKDYLFFGGIKDFDFTLDGFDTRAYGFSPVPSDTDIKLESGSYVSFSSVPALDDTVTLDADTNNRILSNRVTYGATGLNVELECIPIHSANVDAHISTYNRLFFKTHETYRISVAFVDAYGRWSPPSFVCDYKIPVIPVGVNTVSGTVAIKGRVFNMPTGATGYKFLIVDRTLSERTVLMQGVANPLMRIEVDTTDQLLINLPYPYQKSLYGPLIPNGILETASPFNPTFVFDERTAAGDITRDIADMANDFVSVMSPESIVNPVNSHASYIQKVGGLVSTSSSSLVSFYGYTSSERVSYGLNHMDTRLAQFGIPATYRHRPDHLYKHFGTDTANATDKVSCRWLFQRVFDGVLYGAYQSNVTHEVKESRFGDYDGGVTLGGESISMTTTHPHINDETGTIPSNLHVESGQRHILQLVDNTFDYGDFSPFGDYEESAPIVDIMLDLKSQYGGNTHGTKSRNGYIDASEIGRLSNGTIDEVMLFGDTYYGKFKMAVATGAREMFGDKFQVVFDFVYVRLESTVDYRDYCYKVPEEGLAGGGTDGESIFPIEVKQYDDYNRVFSQQDVVTKLYGEPYDIRKLDTLSSRITTSLNKDLGEPYDAFTVADISYFMDIEGRFGQIRKMFDIADSLVVFQDQAIASVQVLPVSQTTGSSGVVTLGKGKLLDSYRYIKTDAGISSLESAVKVDNEIFFIDGFNRTLNSVKDGALSKLLGFDSVVDANTDYTALNLNSDTDGLFVSLNLRDSEVLFRVPKFGWICFDYVRKVFTKRRSYLDARRLVGGTDFNLAIYDSKIWRLDVGEYDEYFFTPNKYNYSGLTLWADPDNSLDKVFDAIGLTGTGVLPESIYVEDDLFDSSEVPTSFKGKYDRYTTHLPRIRGTRNRFRSSNVKVSLKSESKSELIIDALYLMFSIKK